MLSRIKGLVVVTVLGFFGVILTLCAFKNAQLWFLPFFWGDEFVHVQSAYTMADGLFTLNPARFFKMGTFNYGFLFFFQNMVASIPFLKTASDAVVIVPRLLSGLWFLGSLIVLWAGVRRHVTFFQLLLMLLVMATMPAFFRAGFANHPETMMVCFWCLSVFAFFKDKGTYKTWWWVGVMFLALSISAKLQAVVMIPLWGAYRFWGLWMQPNSLKNWVLFLRDSILAFLLSIAVFVITNPYLVHPVGRFAFMRHLNMNLLANEVRNSGLSALGKLTTTIVPYYLSWPLLIIGTAGLVGALALSWIKRHSPEYAAVFAVSVAAVIHWVYVLFFVNRAIPIYFVLGVLSLYLGVIFVLIYMKAVFPKSRWFYGVFAAVMVFQLAQVSSSFPAFFKQVDHFEEQNSIKLFLSESLKPYIKPTDVVLISHATGFDFAEKGLKPNQIELIHGPLQESMFVESEFAKKWSHVPKSRYKTKVFQPKAFIIIRKNDPMLDDAHTQSEADVVAVGPKSSVLVKRLLHNEYGYHLLAENDQVWVFRHINP